MLRMKSGGTFASVMQMQLERAVQSAEAEMVASAQELIITAEPDVPIDTGALRSSGGTEGPTRKGDSTSVDVFFGDDNVYNPDHGRPTSFYAQDQHENMNYTHPRGGKDHYLTDNLAKMRSAITDRIKRAVIKGFTR